MLSTQYSATDKRCFNKKNSHYKNSYCTKLRADALKGNLVSQTLDAVDSTVTATTGYMWPVVGSIVLVGGLYVYMRT